VDQQHKQRAPRWRRKRANIPGYLVESQTAERLGVRVRTLRKWRAQGRGPAFLKLARQILYRDEAINLWLKRHEIEPTRELTAA